MLINWDRFTSGLVKESASPLLGAAKRRVGIGLSPTMKRQVGRAFAGQRTALPANPHIKKPITGVNLNAGARDITRRPALPAGQTANNLPQVGREEVAAARRSLGVGQPAVTGPPVVEKSVLGDRRLGGELTNPVKPRAQEADWGGIRKTIKEEAAGTDTHWTNLQSQLERESAAIAKQRNKANLGTGQTSTPAPTPMPAPTPTPPTTLIPGLWDRVRQAPGWAYDQAAAGARTARDGVTRGVGRAWDETLPYFRGVDAPGQSYWTPGLASTVGAGALATGGSWLGGNVGANILEQAGMSPEYAQLVGQNLGGVAGLLAGGANRRVRQGLDRALSPAAPHLLRASVGGLGGGALGSGIGGLVDEATGRDDGFYSQWGTRLGAGLGGGAAAARGNLKPGWRTAGRTAAGAGAGFLAPSVAAGVYGGGLDTLDQGLQGATNVGTDLLANTPQGRQVMNTVQQGQTAVEKATQAAEQVSAIANKADKTVDQVSNFTNNPLGFLQGGWNNMNESQKAMLGLGALSMLAPALSSSGNAGTWGGGMGLGGILGLLALFYPQLAQQLGLPANPLGDMLNSGEGQVTPPPASPAEASPSTATPAAAPTPTQAVTQAPATQ